MSIQSIASEAAMRTTRHDGHRINITLPTDAYACVAWLAEQRRFGTSPPDVASYLVLTAIERLMAQGTLPAGRMGSDESQDRAAAQADRRQEQANHRRARRTLPR